MNEGLLLARLVFGLLIAAHGAQKAFGWFGGYGLDGTAGFMESLGFRPGRLFAAAAAYTELLSGVLLSLGLLGPAGPALMLSVMIVAGASAHWKNGVFAQNGGYELSLLYAAIAVTLAFTGPGALSLDALLGVAFAPIVTWVALAAGVVGAFANLAARRAPAPAHA